MVQKGHNTTILAKKSTEFPGSDQIKIRIDEDVKMEKKIGNEEPKKNLIVKVNSLGKIFWRIVETSNSEDHKEDECRSPIKRTRERERERGREKS